MQKILSFLWDNKWAMAIVAAAGTLEQALGVPPGTIVGWIGAAATALLAAVAGQKDNKNVAAKTVDTVVEVAADAGVRIPRHVAEQAKP